MRRMLELTPCCLGIEQVHHSPSRASKQTENEWEGTNGFETGVLHLGEVWSKPQLCKRASGHTTHSAEWRGAGHHGRTCGFEAASPSPLNNACPLHGCRNR